jgi:hypothetical protein
MVCTQDAQESTGASSNSNCIGTFAAIEANSTTSEDTSVLRFQSENAPVQPDPLTRVIAWPDYRPSEYPADQLSWKVGESLAPKEVLLVGASHVAGHYSLRNEKCEHDRMFEVQVVQQTGYSVGVVAETRSTMTVRIEDDDFHGHVRIVGLFNGDLVDLSLLPKNASYTSMPKSSWNNANTTKQNLQSSVPGVYLQRSRTPAKMFDCLQVSAGY